MCSLTVQVVGGEVAGELRLPAVTVGQQLGLVVEQLLVRLHGELEVRSLDDGVNGASLLAEATVDALGHVNVVASGAARAVGAGLGLDGDGVGRADGLAQLASDAPFLSGGVAAQCVLAAEARGQGSLLERVVDGDLRVCVA